MIPFDSVLYIQIWPTKLAITDEKTGEVMEELCLVAFRDDPGSETEVLAVGRAAQELKEQHRIVAPFKPNRVLVSDFEAAEKLISYCVKNVCSNSFIRPAPRLVIHPMELPADGISSIEIRAFRELGVSAGAREVKVYTGTEIQTDGFDYNSVVSADDLAGSAIQKTSSVVLESIVSVVILIIFVWLYDAYVN